jgi:hypothetical protein
MLSQINFNPLVFSIFAPSFKIHLLQKRKISHFELPKQVFHYFASET